MHSFEGPKIVEEPSKRSKLLEGRLMHRLQQTLYLSFGIPQTVLGARQ